MQRGPRYFDPPEEQGDTCHTCGQQGHLAADCTEQPRQKPCYVCGEFGHDGYDCSEVWLTHSIQTTCTQFFSMLKIWQDISFCCYRGLKSAVMSCVPWIFCWCRKQSVMNVERVATLLGTVQTNNTSLAGARDVVFFVVDWVMMHLLALGTTILMTSRWFYSLLISFSFVYSL